jgi:hypothetical protein
MTDYDVEAVAFEAWLERRAKQGKRNAIDSLARRLSAETRIPHKATGASGQSSSGVYSRW